MVIDQLVLRLVDYWYYHEENDLFDDDDDDDDDSRMMTSRPNRSHKFMIWSIRVDLIVLKTLFVGHEIRQNDMNFIF